MVILDPVLPKEMTLLKLSMTYKVFTKAERMFIVTMDTDAKKLCTAELKTSQEIINFDF
jgi:hypothetical protein